MASARNKTTKKLSMKQLQAANDRRKLDQAQQAAELRLAKSSRFKQRAKELTQFERRAVDPAELEDTPDPDDDELTGLNGAAPAGA